MKKNPTNTAAFTLIEIIIAMSIFGIMMISVLSIFLFSSQMSTRVEMNRIMQENIKNVTQDIAENIRKSSLANVIHDNS
jgi:prepilin-type N-terminal cleavage/methylation domain-containing protein